MKPDYYDDLAKKFDRLSVPSGDSQHFQYSHGANGKSGSPISEPEPLRRPLPAADPYPMQALGEVLGTAAQRVRDVLCVPEAMAGQSILAAASLAVQAHADVEIDGRRELLSLWAMTIGVSGERKSACDQLALRTHREVERSALDVYSLAKTSHDIDPDAIHHEMTKVGKAPEAPLKPLLLVGNPTVEAVHKQLVDGLPNIGLFHDDAGEFFGGHSMSQDHRVKTAASLSKLWDVPVEIVFDQGLGDLFVIRVAGNIVAPSQIGSVEFAAEQFGTRLVVVLGHSRCGAIRATLEQLQQPRENQSRNLHSIVDLVRPAVEGLLSTDLRNDPDALIDQAVRANIRASVSHLRHGSEIIERLIQKDGLLVVGAEYSLETGVVDFFDDAEAAA